VKKVRVDGGTSWVSQPTPVAVPGLVDAVDLNAAGGGGGAGWFDVFACALRRSGQVVCWGSNEIGVLGNGTNDWSAEPVAVSGLSDAVELAHGGTDAHSCARKQSGAVVCWGGYNIYGQLGNGQTGGGSPHFTVPVTVLPP
jgi:alpha-tubulin suppressor-like RCC1 family protein